MEVTGTRTRVEIGGLEVVRAAPARAEESVPVLFVHGMWEGAWFWERYVEFFSARGYACHAVNLRGRCGSKPVSKIGQVSIHDYLADARTVAEALGNPVLVGHSMGGLLVQKLAELLDPPAVVAVTPAPPRGISALNTWPVFKAALRHSPEILLRRPLLPGKAEMARLQLNRLSPEVQEWVYQHQVPESGRQTFDLAIAGLPVNASRVRCPVLVIGGADDNITPPKTVRKIARKYGADYREYDGFAHMIALEPGWERVADDIAGWLDRATGA